MKRNHRRNRSSIDNVLAGGDKRNAVSESSSICNSQSAFRNGLCRESDLDLFVAIATFETRRPLGRARKGTEVHANSFAQRQERRKGEIRQAVVPEQVLARL